MLGVSPRALLWSLITSMCISRSLNMGLAGNDLTSCLSGKHRWVLSFVESHSPAYRSLVWRFLQRCSSEGILVLPLLTALMVFG